MSRKMLLVAGARPNYMENAPICLAARGAAAAPVPRDRVPPAEHYASAISGLCFSDINLPEPTINLGVGFGSHSEQTAKVMVGFEKVLLERRPHVVVVVGDVNSTVACALVTTKIEL